jgi:hypothetical protein
VILAVVKEPVLSLVFGRMPWICSEVIVAVRVTPPLRAANLKLNLERQPNGKQRSLSD